MGILKSWLLCVGMLCGIAAAPQTGTAEPPYKRFPTPPPFQLLMGDSATLYKKADLPKNKAVLLMIFSPDCGHCQHTAEELVQQKEALKNVQIVMATLHPISQMNAFAQTYGLNALPNVVLGKDMHFILPPFYGIRNLPLLALYNRNGQLLHAAEGSLPVSQVIEIFQKAGR